MFPLPQHLRKFYVRDSLWSLLPYVGLPEGSDNTAKKINHTDFRAWGQLSSHHGFLGSKKFGGEPRSAYLFSHF